MLRVVSVLHVLINSVFSKRISKILWQILYWFCKWAVFW